MNVCATFVVVVGIILCLHLPYNVVVANMQCVTRQASIRFHPDPLLSFINYVPSSTYTNYSNMIVNDKLTITMGEPLPPIIIQILDSNGEVDTEAHGFNITVKALPLNTAMRGESVMVKFGEALFDSFVIDNPVTPTLTFVPMVASMNGMNLTTGRLEIVSSIVNYDRLVFSSTDSYVVPMQTSDSRIQVPVGYILPEVRVRVLNSAFRSDDAETTIKDGSCIINITNQDSKLVGGRLTGTLTVAIRQGFASFTNLLYTGGINPGPPYDYFEVRCRIPVASKTLSCKSGPIEYVSSPQTNTKMRFDDAASSFISTEHKSFTAVVGKQLPRIVIRLVDRFLRKDPTNTGLIIEATCDRAIVLGGVVGVISGVATFDELQLAPLRTTTWTDQSTLPLVLTFTAGDQNHLPLEGYNIQTGIITLMAITIEAYSFSFEEIGKSYIVAENTESQWVLHEPMPSISLRLLTSANEIDTHDHHLTVKVTSTEDGVRLDDREPDSLVATFLEGVAIFDNIRFFEIGLINPKLTFIATGPEGDSHEVIGKKLVTGGISVAKQVVANYDLRFQPYGSSLFTAQRQSTFGTATIPLPLIIVELINNAGVVDLSNDEIVITVSCSQGDLSGNILRVYHGTAMFTELSYVRNVTVNDVVLTFTAGDEGLQEVRGKTLTTGFIQMRAGVTRGFAIRFSKQYSSVQFAEHKITIVKGMVIPAVVIEVVGSDHRPTLPGNFSDYADQLFCKVAIANINKEKQELVGSTTIAFAPMILPNGERVYGVNFSNVVYNTELVDVPITLEFCVDAPVGGFEMHGKCIRSGQLTVEQQAAGARGIAFYPNTSYSIVTRPHQSFSVDSSGLYNGTKYMTFTIQLVNAIGQLVTATPLGSSCDLLSPVALENTRATFVNGFATFTNVKFADAPRGISPIFTFTVNTKSLFSRTIVTGDVNIQFGLLVGKTVVPSVVAEVNQKFELFNLNTWVKSLVSLLNIDESRFQLTRLAGGRYVDNGKQWIGTRVEFKFTEPTVKSRNKQSTQELCDIIVSLDPKAGGVEDLLLRRTYYIDTEKTCDLYLFRENMDGTRMCESAMYDTCRVDKVVTQADGTKAISRIRGPNYEDCRQARMCECYDPIVSRLGVKCIDMPDFTSLCRGTYSGGATTTATSFKYKLSACDQPNIVAMCTALALEEISRTQAIGGLIASAIVLFALTIAWRAKLYDKMLQDTLGHAAGFGNLTMEMVQSDLKDRLL